MIPVLRAFDNKQRSGNSSTAFAVNQRLLPLKLNAMVSSASPFCVRGAGTEFAAAHRGRGVGAVGR